MENISELGFISEGFSLRETIGFFGVEYDIFK